MKKYFIEDIIDKVDQEVTLYGWVHTVRDHKKIIFIDLRDRTGIVQIVGDEKFRDLSPEDVVVIKGIVKKRPEKLINPKINTGTIEVKAESLTVLSKAQTLPIDMGKEELDVTLPILLDNRSLTLRHPKIAAIFKVQDAIVAAFRKVTKELGCIEIFVPTIAASSTEGGAEVFTIDYFEYKATLTQSPQLYKQMLVPVFEKVMTIAHAYRAEPSVTTRHITESTQMDCEFGFAEFEDLLNLLEKVATETLKEAETNSKEELKLFNTKALLFGKIPRLRLSEVQEIIFTEFKRDVRGEKDLSPEDEVDICKWAVENHKSDFVTVTHFPTSKRAFYTMPDPVNPEISLSYDLLFRGVEILSGSQRIHNYEALVAAIKDRGMNPAAFEMYLQAFKYGMPPEGGFSFGLERITKELLELGNIREASLYPRDMERVDIRLSTLKK